MTEIFPKIWGEKCIVCFYVHVCTCVCVLNINGLRQRMRDSANDAPNAHKTGACGRHTYRERCILSLSLSLTTFPLQQLIPIISSFSFFIIIIAFSIFLLLRPTLFGKVPCCLSMRILQIIPDTQFLQEFHHFGPSVFMCPPHGSPSILGPYMGRLGPFHEKVPQLPNLVFVNDLPGGSRHGIVAPCLWIVHQINLVLREFLDAFLGFTSSTIGLFGLAFGFHGVSVGLVGVAVVVVQQEGEKERKKERLVRTSALQREKSITPWIVQYHDTTTTNNNNNNNNNNDTSHLL